MLPGRVLIDEDDRGTYAGMQLPRNWDWMIGERAGLVEIQNRAWRSFPDEPWYAVCGDDLRFTPPGWDSILSTAAGRHHVAWADDGVKRDRLCTAYFVGGDLVRAMGWLAHPAFGHLYADTVWWEIATRGGLARYQPQVKMRHIRLPDRTFAERRIAGDRERFIELRSSSLPALIEKARVLC